MSMAESSGVHSRSSISDIAHCSPETLASSVSRRNSLRRSGITSLVASALSTLRSEVRSNLLPDRGERRGVPGRHADAPAASPVH